MRVENVQAMDFHCLHSFGGFIEETVKEIFKCDSFEVEEPPSSDGFLSSLFCLWQGLSPIPVGSIEIYLDSFYGYRH